MGKVFTKKVSDPETSSSIYEGHESCYDQCVPYGCYTEEDMTNSECDDCYDCNEEEEEHEEEEENEEGEFVTCPGATSYCDCDGDCEASVLPSAEDLCSCAEAVTCCSAESSEETAAPTPAPTSAPTPAPTPVSTLAPTPAPSSTYEG